MQTKTETEPQPLELALMPLMYGAVGLTIYTDQNTGVCVASGDFDKVIVPKLRRMIKDAERMLNQ